MVCVFSGKKRWKGKPSLLLTWSVAGMILAPWFVLSCYPKINVGTVLHNTGKKNPPLFHLKITFFLYFSFQESAY
jgi:hypothetical protein